MALPIDAYLKKNGITDIQRIEDDIVILSKDERRFTIKIKENQTPLDIGNLLEDKLDKPLGRKLCQYIIQFICKSENWDILFPQKNQKKHGPKDVYVQRFSNDQYYAEAALIDNTPKFLLIDSKAAESSIEIVDKISSIDETIRPLKALSYINKPYTFNSNEDVKSFIEKAKNETLDSLYRKVKSIWKRYVDADDFHISICAVDTIFTYYQNMAGMTHYLFFVGGPASGKSNNLEIFHLLAYRNMTRTGITAPNIYAFYGGREEGIGTICEDEANDLDMNEDKMKFYKNGYVRNHPVFRIDDSGNENGGRVQRRYFTFGWKAFAAERLPDSV